MRRIVPSVLILVLCPILGAWPHVGEHPSVHDTVAGIVKRMRETFDAAKLSRVKTEDVLAILSDEERHVLGTEHLTFRVNVPVIVSVIRDTRSRDEPFWLEDRGFKRTKLLVQVERREFDVWEKKFDEGVIGLGINSLSGRGEHYFVAVQSQKKRDRGKVELSEIYPGRHTVGVLTQGAEPYSDEDDRIATLPKELEGLLLLRGVDDRKRDARVLGIFRETDYPATDEPDHVVLTWSDDPKTTQTIQWRTSTAIDSGTVAYAKSEKGSVFSPETAKIVEAQTQLHVLNTLVNDPVIHRHTATLRDLEPGATYAYALNDGKGGWTQPVKFATAPAEVVPFTFMYMGDAQNGLDTWGSLIHKAFDARPDAKFYIMAGDLVDRGQERDDWDTFFENAEGIFDRRQIVPVPGNHEYQGGEPVLYLAHFALPDQGPVGELAYTLHYSNALFVMLDSNISARRQSPWLEEQLAGSDAMWKFVVYHHPAYSSRPNRNNRRLREEWGALFDKYHVDVALQGHDHAYLRTYPMHNEERAGAPAEGTIYIVSVSGTKHYEQGEFDYTEFGMTNVSTYQVLDIRIDGNRLEYRAYDAQGRLRDSFVIEK